MINETNKIYQQPGNKMQFRLNKIDVTRQFFIEVDNEREPSIW